MTRKLLWNLLLFAELTILPGCQSFPYFGSSASDGPKKLDHREYSPRDEANKGPIEEFYPSTLSSDKPAIPTSFEQPNGDKPWLAKQPLYVVPTKKSAAGVTGIVEIETPPPKIVPIPMPGQLPKLDPKGDFEPFLLAMQCMLDGRHQEAIKHLSGYDNDKQEIFLRLAPIIQDLVKKRLEDLTTAEIANMLKGLDGLRDALRPRSELVVNKMLCCREVRGYGWYIPLSESHAFLAGTPERIGEQVKLYVELKNFASEPTKDGEFITKLSCALELRDAKKIVWETKFEGNETTLKRSSRLNDLYSLYGFYVPPVPAGTYQLTLRIADETNPKAVRIASKSMEFRVTPVASPAPLR